MPSTPLVSIITPSYQQAAYLEDTLRSVLAQDYPNLEYIVVDGDSTDGSVEIIQRYSSHLAWWVSERDSGQAEAINKGLNRAQGEIVAWLNSDDLYLPGAVSQAVSALQANPQLGMVFADAITIDPQGRPLNRLAFGDWGLPELMRFRIICQPAVFMRRNRLARLQDVPNGPLDRSYHFLLDHHLWLRLAAHAPIQHIANGERPVLWAAARHHPGAKNVAQAAGFGKEAFYILNWMEQQPDLKPLLAADRRRIEAGAYRLSARYLLDGGQPRPALRNYAAALWRSPRFALQHKHRMLYALAAALRLAPLADRLTRGRRANPPDLSQCPELRDWPGLKDIPA